MEDFREDTEDNFSKSITLLANDEFEVLFRALNRNNEVQFRLLFTPLAQQNMIDLLLDKTEGFMMILHLPRKINLTLFRLIICKDLNLI